MSSSEASLETREMEKPTEDFGVPTAADGAEERVDHVADIDEEDIIQAVPVGESADVRLPDECPLGNDEKETVPDEVESEKTKPSDEVKSPDKTVEDVAGGIESGVNELPELSEKAESPEKFESVLDDSEWVTLDTVSGTDTEASQEAGTEVRLDHHEADGSGDGAVEVLFSYPLL